VILVRGRRKGLKYGLLFLIAVTSLFAFSGRSFCEEEAVKIALTTSSFRYDTDRKTLELDVTVKNMTSVELEGPGVMVTLYGPGDKLILQRSFRARRVALLPGEESEVKASFFVEGPFYDVRLTALEGMGGG